MEEMSGPHHALLSVRDLNVSFAADRGHASAVDGVSFDLYENEILSIVGESGSGKSVTALSILGLVDSPGKVDAEAILFDGQDLRSLSERQLRSIRGKEIAMIFQDPMTALNPLFKVVSQIAEALQTHSDVSKSDAIDAAIDSLSSVGIPNARQRVDDYPHQFSGGMRQRAMIAMAMITEPRILIADEPTTALDVTIQAQILDLLKEIVDTRSTAVLLITHDLGVVASVADRVMVMYAGQIHESGPIEELFDRPVGPYTWGLMDSAPRLNADVNLRLSQIAGQPASIHNLPTGCRFHPRCPYIEEICRSVEPELVVLTENHLARCHFVARKDWRQSRRGGS